MKLVRFAYIDPRAAFEDGASFRVGDVEIGTWTEPAAGSLLVSATIPLESLPPVSDGEVLVPDEPRRRAERALEATTRVLTIAKGFACGLSSPSLTVAFQPETASDREWLSRQSGMAEFAVAVAEPDFPLGLDLAVATRLGDRLDGVALLSEAVANQRMLGRFTETMRVFERAFAQSSDRLVVFLAEFLAQRPLLGYTKSEVKHWVTRVRNRVVHAESRKRDPALEADVRPFVARMQLAAYEVVLNKKEWGSRSTSRRDFWTPLAGPFGPHGRDVFIAQYTTEIPMEGKIWDRFEAYPMHLAAEGLNLPDGFWPSRAPRKVRTRRYTTRVVPRADLAATASP